MIPLRDDNPRRGVPIVTLALIAANVAVFLYQVSLGPAAEKRLLYSMALIPAELTRGIDVGAPTLHPVWLTLFTSMFLHGSWMHLLGNMLYLWIFGDNIEALFGSAKYLLFYLACGVAAMLAHVAANPGSMVPALGASGAIAGVLGAYAVKFPGARVYTLLFIFPFIQTVALPALILLGFWFVYQVLLGAFSLVPGAGGAGVAFFAHIGGFIAGMVLASVFAPRRWRSVWE